MARFDSFIGSAIPRKIKFPSDESDLENNNTEDENTPKRIKRDLASFPTKNEKTNEEEDKSIRCAICCQYITDALVYNGHPNNSEEESVTLTQEKLQLFSGDEKNVTDYDQRPTHKVTHFSVYDRNGHLCPFDSGLIESNTLLYMSGYVKPIYDEDTSIDGGFPTKDMGPINEWFITGFDGGNNALVGFSTGFAEYYLLEPSPDYKPIMETVSVKILLSKIVIEFLLDEGLQNPTYEDLLMRLYATGDPNLTEEALIANAQFVCDRVSSFDSTAINDEEPLLIAASCMRSLVKMAGVSFKKKRTSWKRKDEIGVVRKAKKFSKATTTKLVSQVFETFFVDQLAKKETMGPKKKRCGVCEACQTPDCGQCNHCRDMLKFGGTGRSKQACLNRRCPNMAIEDANQESDQEDDLPEDFPQDISKKVAVSKKTIQENVELLSVNPAVQHKSRVYYDSAKVGDLIIQAGDYVILHPEKPGEPLLIANVCYLWRQENGDAMFHALLFCRGSDTVLGETADPRELFLADTCDNCPLGSIVRKANVSYCKPSQNWTFNGSIEELPTRLEDDGENFFYSKRYDSLYNRFEDVNFEMCYEGIPDTPCDACKRRCRKKIYEKAKLKDGCISWRGDTYKVGNGVFIEINSSFLEQKTSKVIDENNKKEMDQIEFPEYYRKPLESSKITSKDIPQPFAVGLIKEINEKGKDVMVTVRKFYRPEDTHKGPSFAYEKNLNLLYWSDEEHKVNFNEIQGKCYVRYASELDRDIVDWCTEGPYRFYFNEGYDGCNNQFIEVPYDATKIGYCGKGKGKTKGKSKKIEDVEIPPNWDRIAEPLRCMDVFAGCGGLSKGLHQAGIAKTMWAIESNPAAAKAFELNNPKVKMFTRDCNELLREIMSDTNTEELKLPKKGEVELMVGGPPCQGFSGMNRFNAGQYSLFKNSLIVSYLSYCDYYRPMYFILENVRNFVSFKRSMVFKLTLRCLLAIGYQVTFGIVQAGNYGIPQTRRRLIIMAAAPGILLPKYPEPLHVFSKKACQLSVLVDNYRFNPGTNWISSAPYRTITVRDAMSDLPEIKNGSNQVERSYDSEPMTHFQRGVRNDHSTLVKDHICKDMAPLVAARMALIPRDIGSDWRDLPNISVKLNDGQMTNVLRYPYKSKKQKNGEPNRGVCSCASGKGCDPRDRQFNTLIPWCLPHTADRHNHWAGLYGRLEWDGIFSTTVTNPEPMGKQGKVLHPEQHRVVSVRECARSQGFPDSYQFYGSILDKHRQVGNAVPPPLGLALGREILKAFLNNEIILPHQ